MQPDTILALVSTYVLRVSQTNGSYSLYPLNLPTLRITALVDLVQLDHETIVVASGICLYRLKYENNAYALNDTIGACSGSLGNVLGVFRVAFLNIASMELLDESQVLVADGNSIQKIDFSTHHSEAYIKVKGVTDMSMEGGLLYTYRSKRRDKMGLEVFSSETSV